MLRFDASVSGSQAEDALIEDEEEFAEFFIRLAELIKLTDPSGRTILLNSIEDQASKSELVLVRELSSFFSSISE